MFEIPSLTFLAVSLNEQDHCASYRYKKTRETQRLAFETVSIELIAILEVFFYRSKNILLRKKHS